MSFASLAFALALVGLSAAAYNSTQVAETYINLGAGANPTNVNCTKYAALFTSTGLLHQPGVPDVTGTADIMKSCVADHAEVSCPASPRLLSSVCVVSGAMRRPVPFCAVCRAIEPDIPAVLLCSIASDIRSSSASATLI